MRKFNYISVSKKNKNSKDIMKTLIKKKQMKFLFVFFNLKNSFQKKEIKVENTKNTNEVTL